MLTEMLRYPKPCLHVCMIPHNQQRALSATKVTSEGTRHYTLDPLELGIPRCQVADLKGGDAALNAQILRVCKFQPIVGTGVCIVMRMRDFCIVMRMLAMRTVRCNCDPFRPKPPNFGQLGHALTV